MKQIYLTVLCLTAFGVGKTYSQNFGTSSSTTCTNTSETVPAWTASDGTVMNASMRNYPAAAGCISSNGSGGTQSNFCPSASHVGVNPCGGAQPAALLRRTVVGNPPSCAGSYTDVTLDFTASQQRPINLTFSLADIDNPYDSVEIWIYHQGNRIPYNIATNGTTVVRTFGTGSTQSVNGPRPQITANCSNRFADARADISLQNGSLYVDSVVLRHRVTQQNQNPAWTVFGFQWTSIIVLPATMFDLVAQKTQNGWVNLSLKVAQDEPARSYLLQRKSRTGQWESIEQLAAQQKKGEIIYRFTDQFPLAGVNNYRVKQIGASGAVHYSKSIAVNLSVPQSENGLEFFPNPVKNELLVRNKALAKCSISIYDANGALVLTKNNISSAIIKLHIEHLPRGNYYVQVSTNNGPVGVGSFVKL